MPPNRWVEMVREFHEHHLPTPAPTEFHQLTASEALAEASSLGSEYFELLDALRQNDVPEAIDALCDIIYVAIGIGLRFGIDITAAFEDVHDSNRQKGRAAPMTMGRGDGNGGSIKPPGWVGPRIRQLIELQKAREHLVREMGEGIGEFDGSVDRNTLEILAEIS